MKKVAAALLLSSMFVDSEAAKLSCLDKKGKPTAWFANIKFPRSIRKAGDKYAYLDPNTGNKFQVVQGVSIDGPTEALTRTFQLINSVPASQKDQILYNDDNPVEEGKTRGGHTKGVIAYDPKTKTGVYIMHSLPEFPLIKDGQIDTNVDEDQDKFGQHVYCISLNEESFKTVYEHLPVEYPNFYYTSGAFDNLPKRSNEETKISKVTLTNGENLAFFTKAPKFKGLLFEDIVIPQINSPLAVESWGRPYQKPSCFLRKHSVNINELVFADKSTWSHTNDHSKWAVTTGNTKIACFCDMNRMESQAKRGGSCLCAENANIHQALSTLVVDTDKCDVLE